MEDFTMETALKFRGVQPSDLKGRERTPTVPASLLSLRASEHPGPAGMQAGGRRESQTTCTWLRSRDLPTSTRAGGSLRDASTCFVTRYSKAEAAPEGKWHLEIATSWLLTRQSKSSGSSSFLMKWCEFVLRSQKTLMPRLERGAGRAPRTPQGSGLGTQTTASVCKLGVGQGPRAGNESWRVTWGQDPIRKKLSWRNSCWKELMREHEAAAVTVPKPRLGCGQNWQAQNRADAGGHPPWLILFLWNPLGQDKQEMSAVLAAVRSPGPRGLSRPMGAEALRSWPTANTSSKRKLLCLLSCPRGCPCGAGSHAQGSSEIQFLGWLSVLGGHTPSTGVITNGCVSFLSWDTM